MRVRARRTRADDIAMGDRSPHMHEFKRTHNAPRTNRGPYMWELITYAIDTNIGVRARLHGVTL